MMMAMMTMVMGQVRTPPSIASTASSSGPNVQSMQTKNFDSTADRLAAPPGATPFKPNTDQQE
jgi:hypothetical protein